MIYHYIKTFFSNIRKNKFFYSINFIGFLIGFVILTITTSYVYLELNFDKFHTNVNTIYRINSGGYGVTPLCFHEKLNNKIPEISNIIRFVSRDFSIIDNNEDIELGKVYFTDRELFQVFSFKLKSGDQSEVLSEPMSIVLNESTAFKLFGTEQAVGKIIKSSSGEILTITGIMEDIPYGSHIQANAFISLESLRAFEEEDLFTCSMWANLTYINVNKNTDLKILQDKINTVLEDSRMQIGKQTMVLKLQALDKVYFDGDNNKYDGCRHGNLNSVFIYLGASILIMLIVIINYISLFTSVSVSRSKEIAIRKTVGASKTSIFNQIFFESAGIAAITFILSLTILEILIPFINSSFNLNISSVFSMPILILLFVAIMLVCIFLSGLYPSILLSKVNIISSLNNKKTLGMPGFYRKLLLVIQLSILAVLLNSTFQVGNQIDFLLNKDLGFNYDNIVYLNLNKDLQDKGGILKSNLLQNPEILNVSFSDVLIGDGYPKAAFGESGKEKLCYFFSCDPDYLELLQIDIKQGRNFMWNHSTDTQTACILNEEAVKLLELKDPFNTIVGKREIIGTIPDFNYTSLHNETEALVIRCSYKGNYAHIKISGNDIDKTLKYISDVCYDISPDFEFTPSYLKDRIENLYKPEFVLKQILGFISLVVLFIALLGLFGLSLFNVNKRVKEISIKKVYGAGFGHIVKDLSKEYFIISFLSCVLAIPFSISLINKLLMNMEYRVDISFLLFIKSFLMICFFIFGSIAIILVKAAKLNPVEGLRHND